MSQFAELEKKFGGRLDETSMRDRDYKKEKVYWLRFSVGRCPICGEANGWCVTNVTGTKVICMKQPNDHPVGQGYLYYLNDRKPVNFDAKKIVRKKTYKFASAEKRDAMNRLVVKYYPLSDADRKNLHDRGLDDNHIALHTHGGFASIGQPKVQAVLSNGLYQSVWLQALEKADLRLNTWKGVMGFFGETVTDEGGRYELPFFNCVSQGMLVPYYSMYNQILGFQVRLNNPPVKAVNSSVTSSSKKTLLTISIDKYTNQYSVKSSVKSVSGKQSKVIDTGDASGKTEIKGTYMEDGKSEEYVFELKPENKYRWISSRNQNHGAEGYGEHMPIEVAYNDRIAGLSYDVPEEKELLDKYIDLDKGIWLTEGGLKGIVAAANLTKQFSTKQLNVYGRDFLAVAGVTSYADFLPILKKMSVKRATIAFDMDMIDNKNVLSSTTKLANMLIENGIEVYLAKWNPAEAKGIDDALVEGVPVHVTKLR